MAIIACLIPLSVGCVPQKNTHSVLFDNVPQDCQQVVVVYPAHDGVSTAKGMYYEQQGTEWKWIAELPKCYVGKQGFALPGKKAEGNGKTPSGIYPIGIAFGYAETLDTKLSYRQLKDDDFWIDEAKSPDYNKLVSGPKPTVSHEIMRRSDIAYKIGAVIEYNTNPIVAGDGSAIFLHVINPGPDPHTAGCVAMDEETLAKLLAWLDVKKKPCIILNEPDCTADFYDASLAEPKAKKAK